MNAFETFSVWQWLPGGFHECVGRNMPAGEAVGKAHDYTTRPAAKIGIIERVTIVDQDDFTVFEWTFGKGVTFK